MTPPTRRQLSNPTPLTRPTSLYRSVGITRVLSTSSAPRRNEPGRRCVRPSNAKKRPDEIEPDSLALLRMELNAEDVSPLDTCHDLLSVRRRGDDVVFVEGHELVAVDEIEVRVWGHVC